MALSPERIALGRTHVGASAAGALLSVHPWLTMLDVFNSAIYDVPLDTGQDDEAKAHLRWGNRVERPALEQFAADRGWHLRGCPGPLTDARFPAWVVTPDELCETPEGLLPLDAKNVNRWNADHWGAPGTSNAPLYCLAQVQVQIALCAQLGGLAEGCLVATIAGDPPEPYPVRFDPDTFGVLNELAEKFVKDHLIPRRPPDGWEEDRNAAEYVARRWSKTLDPTIRPATQADLDLLLQLRAAEAIEDAASARVKTIKALLAQAVGDAAGIEGIAKWIDVEAGKAPITDWAMVAQHFALKAGATPEEARGVADSFTAEQVTRKGYRYLKPSASKKLPTLTAAPSAPQLEQ